jgi:hypothetical protein
LSEEYFINYWLKKWHNTSIEELLVTDPDIHSGSWYKKYPVTQEQHDEWHEWALGVLMNKFKCGRKKAERGFSFTYLNVAPTIKEG